MKAQITSGGHWSVTLILTRGKWVNVSTIIAITLWFSAAKTASHEPEDPVFLGSLVGHWTGAIEARVPVALSLDFTFVNEKLRVSADVPIWGNRLWPLVVSTVRPTLVFRFVSKDPDSGEFQCELKNDEIRGRYRYHAELLPIVLRRGMGSPSNGVRHWQVPTPSDAYDERGISVKSGRIDLTGILDLPRDRRSSPAIVIVGGSEPREVDIGVPGNIHVDNDSFFYWVLADSLARHGITVLRVDSRGSGRSGGVFLEATLDDLAQDVSACVRFLGDSPGVDRNRIGALGLSQGGIVSSLSASRDRSISFLVLLASPGMRGDQLYVAQNARLMRLFYQQEERLSQNRTHSNPLETKKIFEADEEELREYDRTLVRLIESGIDSKAVVNEMIRLGKIPNDQKVVDGLTRKARKLATPLGRSWLGYDPIPAFEKLRNIRILALQGDADCRIDINEDLPRIETALGAPRNPFVTIKRFHGLGHTFVRLDPQDPFGLRDYATTIDPAVLDAIFDWLPKRGEN